MKVSISLSEEALAKLDAYAREHGLPSRSATVQHAIDLLWGPALQEDYATAWQEWEASGEADAWSATIADGMSDVAR